MNLFAWTAFLPEGFENGIIQKASSTILATKKTPQYPAEIAE